jgi:DNA-binding NtrC family response regulator
MKSKILIHETNKDYLIKMTNALKSKSSEILFENKIERFLEKISDFYPDVIIINAELLESENYDHNLLTILKNENVSNAKIICLYSKSSSALISEALRIGVYQIVDKTSDYALRQLRIFVDNAIIQKNQEEEFFNLQIENINLKKNLIRSYPFIGESKAVSEAKSRIIKLAEADEDMFVIGETGTGKEIAAYFYYLNSSRFAKVFLTVNCSALTETLIESELFGHVKGSFTNADRNKVGFFERCNNGLLFLDEVTNLSLPAQSKILRAIENKEIQVVGGETQKVDTKLIFASNASMDMLTKPEVFRRDLFYRIEGNIIELKPLRSRENDIILLMSFFFSNYSQHLLNSAEYNLNELKDILLSYSWPGNIRELKNFCKFIMLNIKTVDNKVIKKHMEQKIKQSVELNSNHHNKMLSMINLKKFMAANEKEYLLYHLSKNKGHILETAKQIGIERTTLYKKMKVYKIMV